MEKHGIEEHKAGSTEQGEGRAGRPSEMAFGFHGAGSELGALGSVIITPESQYFCISLTKGLGFIDTSWIPPALDMPGQAYQARNDGKRNYSKVSVHCSAP
jgi:hypothetical protein